MYQTINGWTKAGMIEAINTRMLDHQASRQGPYGSQCVYLADDGNRCAVGVFIPDNHPGLKCVGSAVKLFFQHPDLVAVMPLETLAMGRMQEVHDQPVGAPYGNSLDRRPDLVKWIEANVADEPKAVA